MVVGPAGDKAGTKSADGWPEEADHSGNESSEDSVWYVEEECLESR